MSARLPNAQQIGISLFGILSLLLTLWFVFQIFHVARARLFWKPWSATITDISFPGKGVRTTYMYEKEGVTYTGETHSGLQRHSKRGDSFKIYIDPKNPSKSFGPLSGIEIVFLIFLLPVVSFATWHAMGELFRKT